jgi:hypothetical protein
MLRAVLVASSLLLLSCGDSADGSGGSGETGPSTSSTGTADPTCSAKFRVLQKDAYSDVAGRTSELWPPHTTTVLDVTCPGESTITAFQANHGTEPGEVDANGDIFLVEVASFTATGPKTELQALQAAYSSCSCDAATKFLSLDSLEEATAQALLQTVSEYLQQNLTCTGATTDDLVMLLMAGEVAAALEIFPTCSWSSGASFEEGLDEALTTLLMQTQEVLAGYHVCNNDAALQKALFDAYVPGGGAGACDPSADVCRGPLWLYSP